MSTIASPDLAREVARGLLREAEQRRRINALLQAKRLARKAERRAAKARVTLARSL